MANLKRKLDRGFKRRRPFEDPDDHEKLQVRCLRWLNSRTTGRGMRSAWEVKIDRGYVADAVGLFSFSNKKGSRITGEKNIIRHVGIFECKTSRGDFLSTFGESENHENRFEKYGTIHFVATEKDVCVEGEIPEFWGWLERKGSGLSLKKKPDICEVSDEQRNRIARQILWSKSRHRVFT